MHVTDPSTITVGAFVLVVNFYNAFAGWRDKSREKRRQAAMDAQERERHDEDAKYKHLRDDLAQCGHDKAALREERDILKLGLDAVEDELRTVRAAEERRDGALRKRGYDTPDQAFADIDRWQKAEKKQGRG